MGFLCCFSSAEKDETVPLPPRIRSTTTTETAEWLSDLSWASQLPTTNDGTEPKEMTMQQRARTYINSLYPQCARVGSIEDMDKSRARLRDGTCSPYTNDMIIVLDDDFTGVVYSVAIILDLPDGADLTPGKWLKTPEMEEVQFYVLQMIKKLESTKTNLRHAIARIFIGSDAVYCKLHPENVEPTVTVLDSEPNPLFKEFNNEMARAIHQLNNVPQGAFRSFSFEYALKELYERYPGCTVWDEGPLDFKVGSKVFAEPTRLLVARLFQAKPDKHFQPDEDVDASVYRVTKVGAPASEALPPKLLQNRKQQSFPGGIVAITLFVATPLTALWFKTGAYAKSAPLKAAKIAAQELLSKWNREGKLQSCHLTVAIGADFARFKFVGDDFSSKTQIDVKNKEEASSAVARTYPPLDPFFIELKGEGEHELFQSEVQFQSIKQLMRERAQQDPERFRAMAPTLAVMSAQHFVETNYPESVFVDEGEFPISLDGVPTTISNTRLVLAKDPTKETNNVVAAMYLVPLPGDENMSWLEICDKAWIGTVEMNVAEQSLRTILMQWFKENKLADDCMAQVVMGIDATIYRFVDGERFEDYPEERQKQFKWQ